MKKINTTCIIDDDPIFIFGIKRIMEVTNFCENFMIYRNGSEALENLEALIKTGENLPDVILLDLNMPILDGWQFLDRFVKIPSEKKITIYIVSSSVDPADVNKAKSYKAVTNYIIKPITTKRLKEIISEVTPVN